MNTALFCLDGEQILATGGGAVTVAAISRTLASLGTSVIVHHRGSELPGAELVEKIPEAGVGDVCRRQGDLAAVTAARGFADRAWESFGGIASSRKTPVEHPCAGQQ